LPEEYQTRSQHQKRRQQHLFQSPEASESGILESTHIDPLNENSSEGGFKTVFAK